jgi:hypothetical protein
MTFVPYNRTYSYVQPWPTPPNIKCYGNPLSPFRGKIWVLIYRCIHCMCVWGGGVQRVNEDRSITVQCNDMCIKRQEIQERAGNIQTQTSAVDDRI